MKNINKVLDILEETYPDAKCELDYTTPFELLVATILSAQCTDVRVNITTERLFAKAPTPQAIIDMGLEALEAEIKDFSFQQNTVCRERYHQPPAFGVQNQFPDVFYQQRFSACKG